MCTVIQYVLYGILGVLLLFSGVYVNTWNFWAILLIVAAIRSVDAVQNEMDNDKR